MCASHCKRLEREEERKCQIERARERSGQREKQRNRDIEAEKAEGRKGTYKNNTAKEKSEEKEEDGDV